MGHYRNMGRGATWGVFRDGVNPGAGSTVCPEPAPPTPPPFYAFSYTVPSANSAARSFVAAGSGEAREGGPSYEGRIIRRGDQSPEAMCEKARFVLGAMEQRMAALGFGWADVTATQVYTIFDIHPLLAEEIIRRGAISGGLTWHFARPPVQGLDFEMDVRGVARALMICPTPEINNPRGSSLGRPGRARTSITRRLFAILCNIPPISAPRTRP